MEIDQTKVRPGQFITYSNKLWLVLTAQTRTSKTYTIRVWCPANHNITDLSFPDSSCISVVSEPMFTKDFCKGILDIEKMAPAALSLEKIYDDESYISKKQLINEYIKLLQYNEALFEKLNRFNILFSGVEAKEEPKNNISQAKARLSEYIQMRDASQDIHWGTSISASQLHVSNATTVVSSIQVPTE